MERSRATVDSDALGPYIDGRGRDIYEQPRLQSPEAPSERRVSQATLTGLTGMYFAVLLVARTQDCIVVPERSTFYDEEEEKKSNEPPPKQV
jgi:hypothetical protein